MSETSTGFTVRLEKEELDLLAWRALSNANAPRLRDLLAAGFDPNSPATTHTPKATPGEAPLIYACESAPRSSACVLALLEAGAKISPSQVQGTALHHLMGVGVAAREANEDMPLAIRYLAQAGCPINALDGHGDSALRVALQTLHGPASTAVISELLSHGARFELHGGGEMVDVLRNGGFEGFNSSRPFPKLDTLGALISAGARPDAQGAFCASYVLRKAEELAPECHGFLASYFEALELGESALPARSVAPAPRM